jgi:CRISPR-associated protein Csb1
VDDPADWDLPESPEQATPSKGDKTGGKGKKKKDQLNEVGHGMVPPVVESVGGVSIGGAQRLGWLSFAGLARLGFPGHGEDAALAARTALAALALAGDRLAFARPALRLRSGCDLVLVTERLEWVLRGGDSEPFELGPEEALALVETARQAAADAGLAWADEEVALEPQGRLARAIAASLVQFEPAAEDEEG